MRMMMAGVLAAGWLIVSGAQAQAPAGAPAGAMGICKDGTYSMQVKKEGACRGHKGVQTWYAATGVASAAPMPAVAAAKPVVKAPAAMPAPAPAASVPAKPMPTPMAATPSAMPAPGAVPSGAPAGKRLSPAQAAAQKLQAAGGGPGLVWVNTESKVYHCNGDTYYGKTKAGQYMTEEAAKAAGARGERGKTCAGK